MEFGLGELLYWKFKKLKNNQEQQKHQLFWYLAHSETHVHDENVSVLPSVSFVVWSKIG